MAFLPEFTFLNVQFALHPFLPNQVIYIKQLPLNVYGKTKAKQTNVTLKVQS
jgi:hypothetical protein